jgi:flagellar protein FliO/FliZ
MSVVDYSQFILSLLFVLGLIGAAAFVARRLGLAQTTKPAAGQRRLSIIESLALDGKRRLLLVRRDDVEHLVILGPSTEVVVERNIRCSSVAVSASEVIHEN